jgi:serine/threonine-protein kinase
LVSDRGSLGQAEALRLAHGVATALADAHAADRVHGRLGPHLVVIDEVNGEVTVRGFGDPSEEARSAPDAEAWLAPEQVAGEPADARSDLYALGCLMMATLTGWVPAPAAPTGPDDGSAEASTGAPWPSDHRPDVDPALNGLVHDLLATSPARRPESAEEVIGRLERIEADLGDVSVPVGLAAQESDLPDAEDSSGLAAFGFFGDDDGTRLGTDAEPGSAAAANEPRTQPIPVVVPGQDDSEGAEARPVGGIPVTWLVGSLGAVALVLAFLLLSFLGGRSEAPVAAAPATSAPTAVGSPSASEAPASPSTTATTTTSSPTTSTPTRTTSTPVRSQTQAQPPVRTPNAVPPPPAPQVTLAGAIDALRAAARGAVSSGEVDGRASQELIRRADDLAKWLERNPSQLERKASDLNAYLNELRRTGQITEAGYRSVSQALDGVRSRL